MSLAHQFCKIHGNILVKNIIYSMEMKNHILAIFVQFEDKIILWETCGDLYNMRKSFNKIIHKKFTYVDIQHIDALKVMVN